MKKFVSLLFMVMVSLMLSATAFAMTQEEAVTWAESKLGIKVAGSRGQSAGQCAALISSYVWENFNWDPQAAAKYWATIRLPEGWERFEYYEGFIPEPGDILVKTTGKNGHVAIVIKADEKNLTTIDQNVGADDPRKGTVAQKWDRTYTDVWGFVRPPFNGLPGVQLYEVKKPELPKEPVKEPTMTLMFTLDNKEYTVNGVSTQMDVAPTSIEGTTYLPVSYVTNPLGATTSWDAADKRVTVLLEDISLEMWIDNPIALRNEEYVPLVQINLGITPVNINGRVMVPMRFLAEKLGCQVEWLQDTKQIKITK